MHLLYTYISVFSYFNYLHFLLKIKDGRSIGYLLKKLGWVYLYLLGPCYYRWIFLAIQFGICFIKVRKVSFRLVFIILTERKRMKGQKKAQGVGVRETSPIYRIKYCQFYYLLGKYLLLRKLISEKLYGQKIILWL